MQLQREISEVHFTFAKKKRAIQSFNCNVWLPCKSQSKIVWISQQNDILIGEFHNKMISSLAYFTTKWYPHWRIVKLRYNYMTPKVRDVFFPLVVRLEILTPRSETLSLKPYIGLEMIYWTWNDINYSWISWVWFITSGNSFSFRIEIGWRVW